MAKGFQRLATLLTALGATFILAGCGSSSVLQIHSNDTYSFQTKLDQPQLNQELKCRDRFPGLEEQLKNPNLSVVDQSSDKQVKCELSIKNQPIASAKAPFVTIKHIGDRYQVTLPPFKELDFIDSQADAFSLEIQFPGPVLDPGKDSSAQVKGNKIRWQNASVIVEGFTVSGQDHPGMTRSSKLWLFGGGLAAILLLLLVFLRKTTPIAPIWQVLTRAGKRIGRIFLPALLRLAEYLDISYRRSTRKGKRKNPPGEQQQSDSNNHQKN